MKDYFEFMKSGIVDIFPTVLQGMIIAVVSLGLPLLLAEMINEWMILLIFITTPFAIATEIYLIDRDYL